MGRSKKNRGKNKRKGKIRLPQKGEPGYMQYTKREAVMVADENGKKRKMVIDVEYKFENKVEENVYRNICELAFGSVPCDVFWAKETTVYKMNQN